MQITLPFWILQTLVTVVKVRFILSVLPVLAFRLVFETSLRMRLCSRLEQMCLSLAMEILAQACPFHPDTALQFRSDSAVAVT